MTDLVIKLEKDIEKLKDTLNELKSDEEDVKYEYEKIEFVEIYVKVLKAYNDRFNIYIKTFIDFIDKSLVQISSYKNDLSDVFDKNDNRLRNILNICDSSQVLLNTHKKQFLYYRRLISSYLKIFDVSSDDTTLIKFYNDFEKNDFIETLEDFLEESRNFDKDQYNIVKSLGWVELFRLY